MARKCNLLFGFALEIVHVVLQVVHAVLQVPEMFNDPFKDTLESFC